MMEACLSCRWNVRETTAGVHRPPLMAALYWAERLLSVLAVALLAASLLLAALTFGTAVGGR
jgi:hypothetical protein